MTRGSPRFGSWSGKLRNEVTAETVLFDHLELARLLPPEAPLKTDKPTGAKPTIHAALESLDSETRALIPHLRELVDGTPAVGDEPRPEYALSVPMKWRLESKLLELDKLRIDMSIATLKRRLKRYREEGAAGLGDGRSKRTEAPLVRVNEDVLDALAHLIAHHKGRTATSYTALRAELSSRLVEAFPDPADRPALPSISSVERYVRFLSGDQNPTASANKRATAALSPKHTFRQRMVSAPGDECQIDTTRFDAMVRMPDGSIKRPHLTTLIDKRTRSIVGSQFTAEAPRGEDHAVLIARTLVPRKLRPWSKHYAQLDLPEMPWAPYAEDGHDDYDDTHRPYIFPRRIVVDNGQDYRSVVLLATCQRYGIHLTEAPPKTPTGKAHVERHFGTIRTLFTQYLPRYVGHNVDDRGEKSTKNDEPLDLRTVSELFDRWVAIVWQNREHTGLIDPHEPGMRHTPNSMYAASLELHGTFMIPLGEEDYIALMPRVQRTVQVDGVEFRGRKYDSPHLAPMRLQKDSKGKSVPVDVHYDHADHSQVWVRSTDDGAWVICEWSEDSGLARPHEQALLARAKELTRTKKGFSNSRAHDLMVQLRDESMSEERRRKAAEKEAEKAKRMQARRDAKRLAEIELAGSNAVAARDFGDYTELDVY